MTPEETARAHVRATPLGAELWAKTPVDVEVSVPVLDPIPDDPERRAVNMTRAVIAEIVRAAEVEAVARLTAENRVMRFVLTELRPSLVAHDMLDSLARVDRALTQPHTKAEAIAVKP